MEAVGTVLQIVAGTVILIIIKNEVVVCTIIETWHVAVHGTQAMDIVTLIM
jgi:hypothetical protein